MAPPLVRTLHRGPRLSAVEYQCRQGPRDPAAVEHHDRFGLAFVARGSFGYRVASRRYELIAGGVMIAHAGRDYLCTHEHGEGHGDVCVSFSFAPELLDELGGRAIWEGGCLPPLAEVMVLGQRVRAAAAGRSDVAIDELGAALATRVVELAEGHTRDADEPTASDRRRAVRAAELIQARSREPLDLETIAAAAGLSPFHFLRMFGRVLGVTPHQYLVRTRLAAAAGLLLDDRARSITDVALDVGFGDVSSFVRTFGRAARMSPGRFRASAGADDRKILQERARPPRLR